MPAGGRPGDPVPGVVPSGSGAPGAGQVPRGQAVLPDILPRRPPGMHAMQTTTTHLGTSELN